MAANTFKKAARFYARKKYAAVIRLLEPQVFRYRDDSQFYYLLGSSCLHTGDFGGAFSYLKRCLSLKPLDENTLLSLAVVHLKREETAEAIRNWFSVLDENPKCKIAARGLKIIKKQNTAENLFTAGKYQKLLPSPPKIIFPYIMAFFLLAGVITGSGLIVKNIIINTPPKRDVGINFTLSEHGDLTGDITEALYILSEKEIESIYQKAYKAFQNFDDNKAQFELNKLLFSNASESVKINVDKMISFLRIPSFLDLRTNFTYGDVKENIYLYNNCYVIWKGMISNLTKDENTLYFDLLVGYHTQQELEGTVLCFYDIADQLKTIRNGDSAEILAQIIPSGSDFRLKVRSYHKLIQE